MLLLAGELSSLYAVQLIIHHVKVSSTGYTLRFLLCFDSSLFVYMITMNLYNRKVNK